MSASEPDDIRFFLVRALGAMLDACDRLGDEHVNDRLPVRGSNSAYAIVTHCLGVCEYWIGHVVAGRDVVRDRAAEFTAAGGPEELRARVAEATARIDADLAAVTWGEPVRRLPGGRYEWAPATDVTQRAVLLHVLEELATHRGHLEVTADAVLAGLAGRAGQRRLSGGPPA